jgi:hypothetical protein
VNLPNVVCTLQDLKRFFEGVAEVKQIVLAHDDEPCMVEFVTAVGAAKAIVYSRENAFLGHVIEADYAPSIKEEDLQQALSIMELEQLDLD